MSPMLQISTLKRSLIKSLLHFGREVMSPTTSKIPILQWKLQVKALLQSKGLFACVTEDCSAKEKYEANLSLNLEYQEDLKPLCIVEEDWGQIQWSRR